MQVDFRKDCMQIYLIRKNLKALSKIRLSRKWEGHKMKVHFAHYVLLDYNLVEECTWMLIQMSFPITN